MIGSKRTFTVRVQTVANETPLFNEHTLTPTCFTSSIVDTNLFFKNIFKIMEMVYLPRSRLFLCFSSAMCSRNCTLFYKAITYCSSRYFHDAAVSSYLKEVIKYFFRFPVNRPLETVNFETYRILNYGIPEDLFDVNRFPESSKCPI